MDPRRLQRVSEALKEELAEILEYEMSDPLLGNISVVDVLVSPDLRLAHVRVLLSEDAATKAQALAALDGARHFLRRQLAGRLRLFRVPEILFEEQSGTDARTRVEELLKRVKKSRAKAEGRTEEKA